METPAADEEEKEFLAMVMGGGSETADTAGGCARWFSLGYMLCSFGVGLNLVISHFIVLYMNAR